MKKANKPKPQMVTMTLEEALAHSRTPESQERLKRLAELPDDQIDLSDIPEIPADAKFVRGRFTHPKTAQISIRLTVADLEKANSQAAAKGLPYQTYIKSLLHEALDREEAVRK